MVASRINGVCCCWPDDGAVLDAGASIIGMLLEADCGRDCDTVGDRVEAGSVLCVGSPCEELGAIGIRLGSNRCLDARSLARLLHPPHSGRQEGTGNTSSDDSEEARRERRRIRRGLCKNKSARNFSRASSLVCCSIAPR